MDIDISNCRFDGLRAARRRQDRKDRSKGK
jgi:hypothetical protein